MVVWGSAATHAHTASVGSAESTGREGERPGQQQSKRRATLAPLSLPASPLLRGHDLQRVSDFESGPAVYCSNNNRAALLLAASRSVAACNDAARLIHTRPAGPSCCHPPPQPFPASHRSHCSARAHKPSPPPPPLCRDCCSVVLRARRRASRIRVCPFPQVPPPTPAEPQASSAAQFATVPAFWLPAC